MYIHIFILFMFVNVYATYYDMCDRSRRNLETGVTKAEDLPG